MKKGFIFTAGLALVLSCGVAVGAHSVGSAKEVGAAPVSTVYCKMTYDWWKADGAAIGAHFFDSTTEPDTDKTTWPGDRMSPVAGQTDLWSIAVPSGADSVIFTRINGSGTVENWGAKTADLQIPSLKNCYTITSESAVWGDPGVTGEWSVYPAVAPEYHVLGTFNSWNDGSGDYILTVDFEDSNHYTFTDLELAANAELKICDVKNDDWYDNGSGNIVVAKAGTYDLDFYVDTLDSTHVFLTEQVDPTAVKYYAKVGEGEFTLMSYHGSFVYDTTKTGYEFELTDVDATSGDYVSFRKESSEAIEPGASEVREDKQNNLLYSNTTSKIKVVQTVADQTLRLFVYESGYDSFLSGLTENVKTFYFTNNQSWSGTPKFYAFFDDEFARSEWPGSEMTFADIDGDNHSRYSFSVDVNKWPNLVIANNDGTDQTVDLKFSSVTEGKNGFYLNERDAEKENHWTIGEYTYVAATRSILVGSAAQVLSPTESYEEEGYVAQYETPDFEMFSQDSIKYYVGSDEKPFTLQAYGRNNAYMNSTTPRILTHYTGKLYVKITTGGEAVVFVSGIASVSEGYHIYLNDDSIIELKDWEGDIPEGFDGQTYCEAVTFHEGDQFRLVDTKGNKTPQPFSPARFDEASEAVFKFEDGVVKYTGTTDYEASIYLKLKSENDMIYVGGALPENAAAKKFAIGFNEALGAVCKYDNTTDYDALETAWLAQKTAFTALTTEAKNVLRSATPTHDIEEIGNFIAKYEYIFARYGSRLGAENNFLGEGHAPATLHFDPVGYDGVPTASVIAIVSVVSVLSISAIIVLVAVKKRKHN